MPPKSKKKSKSDNSSGKNKKGSPNVIFIKNNLGPCEVKNCNNPAVCVWSSPDGYSGQTSPHRICSDCIQFHHNHNHSFNLQDEFGYDKIGKMDKFGFSAAKDMEACLKYLEKFKKKANSNSIERLREWRKKNPNKKRVKKYNPKTSKRIGKKKSSGKKSKNKKIKKRPTLATMKTKEISKSDIDNVFDDILG